MKTKVLSIDYGTNKIGVAISDPNRVFAFGLDYISVKKGRVFDKIKSIVLENSCGEILVGLPLSIDGEESKRSRQVRLFVNRLKDFVDIPITFWDERLSSYEAESILRANNVKVKKRKDVIDSLSAKIILQEYLDSGNPI